MEHKNHPGVYIPPPLIYVAFFLAAIILQKKIPIGAAYLGYKTRVRRWL
jgi:hypothetical protein